MLGDKDIFINILDVKRLGLMPKEEYVKKYLISCLDYITIVVLSFIEEFLFQASNLVLYI